MARDVGLGPVFAFEWLMASRRWQAYALRSFTVALFLAAMTLIWAVSPYARDAGTMDASIQELAQIGRAFFTSTAMILLGLIGLAAPAATAGSICLDKARGNLTLLFATDLKSREIVLGKLAARMVPVLGLILCAAPVMAIGTLFGGIDPVDLIGSLFVMVGVAFFGCSLALLLSIWGKKTHEVLILTYVILIAILLAPVILLGIGNLIGFNQFDSIGLFRVMVLTNPVFLTMSTIEPTGGMWQVTLKTNLVFLAAALAFSATMLAVSTWRIRSVVVHQLGKAETSTKRRRSIRTRLADLTASDRFDRAAPSTSKVIRWLGRVWPSPSLDRNPVLWRECQRTRPSKMSVLAWSMYVLLCGGFSLYAIGLLWMGHVSGVELGIAMNVIQVPLGLLLLSVSAATSLSEERQRGSLDVLLATPMATREIVWGKWRGSFRSVPPLMILPTAVAIALSFETGRVMAAVLLLALIASYGAAITSLGLALATWCSRMGRAIGLTTGLYIFMCVAWPIMSIVLLSNSNRLDGLGVASGSPFVGIAVVSAMIGGDGLGPGDEMTKMIAWTSVWTLGYFGIAACLLLFTISTFDRCLGRIDDLSELTPWGGHGRPLGNEAKPGGTLAAPLGPTLDDRPQSVPLADTSVDPSRPA